MSCMCGDLYCSSCGPAQGADGEHLALCEILEVIIDETSPDDLSDKLATTMLKQVDEARTSVARSFESYLKRIVGAKKAKHISNVVLSEDYDEELDLWLDEKFPRKP